MKTAILLFLVVASVAFSAEPAIPEGEYSPAVPAFAGRYIELSKGSFVCSYFTDVGPDPKAKKPWHAETEKGRYQIDGTRLILLGDNPMFAEVLFYRKIGGVGVLLDHKVLVEDHPAFGEFFVLRPKSATDGAEWWSALLKAHPELNKWVTQ
jgi:hypothetical protein